MEAINSVIFKSTFVKQQIVFARSDSWGRETILNKFTVNQLCTVRRDKVESRDSR